MQHRFSDEEDIMLIKVLDLVGKNAMTLADGEAVYTNIHDHLIQGETVELDFAGVEVFASPFFNAGIGRLVGDISAETLNAHLKFDHLSDFGARILRRVIENAKEYYSAPPQQQETIGQIVRDSAATA